MIKKFLPLFLAQFMGAFNDNIFKQALIIAVTYIYAVKQGFDPKYLVVLGNAIFILPFFLLSAIAGEITDKFPKDKVVIASKIFEIAIIAVGSIGFLHENIVLLFACLFMLGVQSTFFGPVKYSVIPELVTKNQVLKANSLVEAGTFLAILAGTILGNSLITMDYGVYTICFIMIFAGVTGLIASFFMPKLKAQSPEIRVKLNILASTIELIKYNASQRRIFLCTLGISWFWFVGAIFLSQFPILTKDVIHADEHLVAVLLAIFSIGIAIGSAYCNILLKGEVKGTYVPLASIVMTLFILDMFFVTRSFPVVAESMPFLAPIDVMYTASGVRFALDLFMIAFFGGLYIVPQYSILQIDADEKKRASVIAANNIMNALFIVASSLVITLLYSLGFTVAQVFLVVAMLNTCVSIIICGLLPDAITKSFVKWILQLFYRVEIKGLEHYKKAGKRVVIVPNHLSYLDPVLISAFLPDTVTFAVNTFVARKWWMRVVLRFANSYQVDQTNPMAMKSLINLIKENRRVVIFPEGRITVTGTLMKVYEGPGLVADKSDAYILPVRISGPEYTHFSKISGIKKRLFPKITITILPSSKLNVPYTLTTRKRRAEIGRQLYDIMSNMLFETSNLKQTLFEKLLKSSNNIGKNHVIIEDIERIPNTYGLLIRKVFVLAQILKNKLRGQRYIAIMLPNTVALVAAFFAMQALGKVPTMINFTAGAKNILSACETAQAKKFITSRVFIEKANLSSLIASIEADNIEIIYLEDLKSKISLVVKATALFNLVFKRFVRMSVDEEAVILFTSGSEGAPKGVVLTHQNLIANCYQLCSRVDFTIKDRVFNALPLFHSFGLSVGTILPLIFGVRVFLYPTPLHYRIIPEMVYDTDSTMVFATDTFLTGYTKFAHPYDFYSVRYIFAGAERLRPETRDLYAQKYGIRILEGYGVTETSPVISFNSPMHNKTGTVGRLLPGVTYRLEAVQGIEEGGRLYVHGLNVMKGYLLADNPGHIKLTGNGWHDTGDIVTVDESGFITIKGRAKRFAKIGGEMVSLTAVEQFISSVYPGFMHAIIAIPDSKKGEQLILYSNCGDITRLRLLSYAKDQGYHEFFVPKKITIIEKLPVLGTGKVDYVTLSMLSV